MANDLDRFLAAKRRAEAAQRDVARLEAELKLTLDALRGEFGVGSLEEGQQTVKRLAADVTRLEAKFRVDLDAFEATLEGKP